MKYRKLTVFINTSLCYIDLLLLLLLLFCFLVALRQR